MISQKLKDSIFSRDFSQVEALLQKLSQSEDAEEAASLAHRAGSIRALVTVLRVTDHQGDRDWEELFIEYVGELSQDSTAASWFDGVESFLWQSLNAEPRDESSPFAGLANLEESQAEDLRFLSRRTGGWPVWDEVDLAPKVVPLAEWKILQAR